MKQSFALFDMDGVLLAPGGYHQSLQESVQRIGVALGVPKASLSNDQIARFESLSVTNEWDSLAICTALILLHVWQFDGAIRFNGINRNSPQISKDSPDFDQFLDDFHDIGDLPGHSALEAIVNQNSWLDSVQVDHLANILHQCRDIYTSLTLPIHQETVLGSQTFHENYQLKPQLNIKSYLLQHDRPMMRNNQLNEFKDWLSTPNSHAGIMTNRPSRTPPDYLSSPEAELGAALIGLDNLPVLGSGLLAWFAVTKLNMPDHTFLKPHPIHTLALLQMLIGRPAEIALNLGYSLSVGNGNVANWGIFQGASIIIFEDAVKGLQSGITAQKLLQHIGVSVDLTLIGVTENSIKKNALNGVADVIINNINQIDWRNISDIMK
jgi:hypothetical protein